MGKKTKAQKEIPPTKNAEGSSSTQPAAIPANVPPQGIAEPSVPLSQVVDLLKLANPGVDWGMVMAAMGLAAQNPLVTTVPPAVTVPTPTVTSPTTERLNQTARRAVEPENLEPSSPEKIETPQTVLDVSPVSVYEPPTAEAEIDEKGEEERDEGDEEGRKGTQEEKGKEVEKSGPKKEEEKVEEELDGDDEKDVGDEEKPKDVDDENEEGEDLEDAEIVSLEGEEIADKRLKDKMRPGKKNEWPFRVIRYKEELVMGDASWESAVAVPEDTPPIKIRAKFLAALPKFSESEDEGPWGTLNTFYTICWRRRLQIGVPLDIFQMVTFPYCLSGEAARWFKSLAPGSITTWLELRTAFLREFANRDELDAPTEAWFKWSIAKAKWAVSDDPKEEDMPTLEAEVARFNESKEQLSLQREAATNQMWNMAKHQILDRQMANDPELEKNWKMAMNHEIWKKRAELKVAIRPHGPSREAQPDQVQMPPQPSSAVPPADAPQPEIEEGNENPGNSTSNNPKDEAPRDSKTRKSQR